MLGHSHENICMHYFNQLFFHMQTSKALTHQMKLTDLAVT